MKQKVLVVLSGGQDSTTCLFMAKAMGHEIHALTFDYGQLHHNELMSATIVARMADCASHEIVHIPHNLMKSTSPLVDHSKPLDTYANAEVMAEEVGTKIEKTFVPMRNALFLTIAANRAVAIGSKIISTGICSTDNANYPDCTPAFRWRTEEYINESLGVEFLDVDSMRIVAPLLYMDKQQIVYTSHSMRDCWQAMSYTLTSYDGVYPPTGKNHSNLLRADGFLKANLPDPLVLRANFEGLMELPDSPNYDLNIVERELSYLAADRLWTL